MASRLSENPARRVLLLEAGGHTPLWYRAPLASVAHGVLLSKKFNWRFNSEPEPFLDSRRIYQPRGKGVGGSSAINGMIWVRGHPEDYDKWAELTGDERWRYAAFKEFFKKCENAREVSSSEDRGFDGPMHISHNRWPHRLSYAFVEAARERGLAENADFNSGENTQGVGFYELNQKKGSRWHAGTGYLSADVVSRANLTVKTGATARKILLEETATKGVEFVQGSEVFTAHAPEVTLCSGVFHSPQLLMLSGIGPAEHLKELGVAAVVDAPAVGSNLQDHLDVGVAVSNPTCEALGLSLRALPMLCGAPLQWLLKGTGPLATNGVDAGGYVASSEEVGRPDLQLHFFPGSFRDYSVKGTVGHQFALNVYLSRPKSKGRLWLASADVDEKPKIVFNFLQEEEDRKALTRGVRIAREILKGTALRPFRGEELLPGHAVQSDEEILAFLRKNTKSAHHPIGTCAMGEVLDSELKVKGVQGLRVCDASAFPTHITSNPHSTVIAMAELCAELIGQEG